MTPAQKQHARDLHNYYWKRMRDIMSERHQLSLAMAVRTSGILVKLKACLCRQVCCRLWYVWQLASHRGCGAGYMRAASRHCAVGRCGAVQAVASEPGHSLQTQRGAMQQPCERSCMASCVRTSWCHAHAVFLQVTVLSGCLLNQGVMSPTGTEDHHGAEQKHR